MKNNGPNKSINVVATDILPNSLKLISYTVSKGTYNVTTGKWNIGDLENKEVAVIIFITKSLRTSRPGPVFARVAEHGHVIERFLPHEVDKLLELLAVDRKSVV